MSRYFWIFAFFAINGVVPGIPRSYHTLRVPPKPGWPKRSLNKSLVVVAPVGLKALTFKDEDIDDILFVASPAFADLPQAQKFVLKGVGKLVYGRAANAVLYEVPDGPVRRQARRRKGAAKKRSAKRASKKRSAKRATAKNRPVKRAAAKKRATKRVATKKRAARKR